MRYLFVMIGCCLCLGLGACEDKAATEREMEMQAAVESLVQAERDFAATVKAEGIRAGFLSVLHPDGILFNPTPTNGVTLYEAAGESGALLTWEPRYAELASSLDLGYTTGPWEYFTSDTASEAVAFGDYFSIWKKDSSGVWKLVLDLGVSRSAPESIDSLVTKTGRGRAYKAILGHLLDRDESLDSLASQTGIQAYIQYATQDIRVLRDNTPAAHGIDGLAESNIAIYPTVEAGGGFSRDGDLGYVFGTAKGKLSQSDGTEVDGVGGYVRVWRQVEGMARLAAEVMSLRPKQ